MTDTKRLRERTEVLSFFINILILERGSGMKSFSAFITEKKKPEKPEGVNQANVSKDAANYRRAQRQRTATGGPTTGRTGRKSFPGDRSGAYQAAKADLEARKGFSGSKSGGLKADEANPNVNRTVRQQRTVKQGIPDPFKSSTKAPENPFKGLRTGNKPTAPDPFKGATSPGPKPKPQGPEQKLGPGPAETEARRNIRSSQARLDKTKPGTVSNIRDYVKSQTKGGSYVSPELEDALLRRTRTRGTEERIGGDTAPSRKPRTSGKPTSAAVSSARASGDYRVASVKSSVMGPETKKSAITSDLASAKPETRKLIRATPRSSSFKEFSRQATALQKKLKSNNPSLSPAGRSAGVQRSSALARQTGNPMRQGAFDAFMNRVDKAKVKVDEPKAISGGKPALPGAPEKPPKPPKPKKPSSLKLPPARKTAALTSAAKNAPVTKGMLKQMGGRALGLAGSAYDAVSSYQEYKKRGDSDLRAGVKSAFRTGLGYAGGALGGLAGAIGGGGIGSAVTGTAGAIGGYSAGTWLADKILGATRYERKKRAREKAAAKAAANQK